jgi:hypothetical protein
MTMNLVMSPSTTPSAWWSMARSRWQGRWRTARRPRHVYVQAAADEGPLLDAVKADFAAWCAAHAGERCHVALSSRSLLTCVNEPGVNLDAARQQALQQWGHYLDLDAPVLSEHWLLRHVQHEGVHLVCAAPRALIEGLQVQAKAHGVRIEAMVPWWVAGVQAWLMAWPPVDGDVAQTAHLQLREPGLITHVQAVRPVGQPACLQGLWVEVCDDVASSPGTQRVILPAPAVALDGAQPALTTIIWDHPDLMCVLTGQSTAWQVAP